MPSPSRLAFEYSSPCSQMRDAWTLRLFIGLWPTRSHNSPRILRSSDLREGRAVARRGRVGGGSSGGGGGGGGVDSSMVGIGESILLSVAAANKRRLRSQRFSSRGLGAKAPIIRIMIRITQAMIRILNDSNYVRFESS